jgi:LysR family nitrogen assimilation transcriptional regulator
MRARYPDISLQLTEELTGNLIEQLKTGRINLAILFDDGQLASFATTPLVEEEMMFITRSGSQHAGGRRSITFARAVKARLILPGMQHGVRPRIESVARAAGLTLDNVIEISSVTIMKSAILADIGATILPVAPLLPEIKRGEMNAYSISGEKLSRTLTLCASKNIPLTTAAAAVERLVLEVTDELCRSGQWLHAKILARP